MLNILIVDDNEINRIMIRELLDEYKVENKLDLKIEEAVNGEDAIDKALEEFYDIIFMDINMPIIDGIEATGIIKSNRPSTMIIAVSAQDKEENVKEILINGAEDYIFKPINVDIFFSRIKSYASIIKAKNHKLNHVNKINVYTTDVYSRYTKFFIESENNLAEFWECFLGNGDELYESEHDVIRTVFALAEEQYLKERLSEVYLEESEEAQYFSIINITNISKDRLNTILKKSPQGEIDYKIEEKTLSIKLAKIKANKDIELSTNEPVKTQAPVEKKSAESVQTTQTNTTVFKGSQKELIVFDYIDDDDLEELRDNSSRLISLMLMVGTGSIEDEDIVHMSEYLDNISSLLSPYTDVYKISTSLGSLAGTMQSHIDTFIEKSDMLGPLCKAFVNDISTWIRMSFETGAPSIDFMNDTISVNCETISSVLTMDDNASSDEADLDDIFDF